MRRLRLVAALAAPLAVAAALLAGPSREVDGLDEAVRVVNERWQAGDLVVASGLPPHDVDRAFGGRPYLWLERPRAVEVGGFRRIWRLDRRASPRPPRVGLGARLEAHTFGEVEVELDLQEAR